MSCYVLTPHNPGRYTVRVGWNEDVGSFYLYVSRNVTPDAPGGGDRDRVAVSLGFEVERELPTIGDLERALEEYARLPAKERDQLLADQREGAGAREVLQGQGTG